METSCISIISFVGNSNTWRHMCFLKKIVRKAEFDARNYIQYSFL